MHVYGDLNACTAFLNACTAFLKPCTALVVGYFDGVVPQKNKAAPGSGKRP
jgi:hypothetical protein